MHLQEGISLTSPHKVKCDKCGEVESFKQGHDWVDSDWVQYHNDDEDIFMDICPSCEKRYGI